METNEYRQNAMWIIYNTKKLILIVQYQSSWSWTLPKGGIEQNESRQEWLLREIDEEVGIKRADLNIEFKYKNPFIKRFSSEELERKKTYKNEFFIWKEDHIFIVSYKWGDFLTIDTRELSDYKRITAEQLQEFITKKDILSIIDIEFLSKFLSYID